MNNITQTIKNRISTRAYLDKPVAKEVIEQILATARWAPSGANTQPWQVAVVAGKIKQQISTALTAARAAGTVENPDYQYYPHEWFEPYKTRRVTCGMALYQSLGIERDDAKRRKEQWYKNYQFFDAPVGLLFFIDKALDKGSWLDFGMFIQNVMLAAESLDLGSCPQASLAEYPDIVRHCLAISDQFQLICGMSLGYPDTKAPENNYRTERAPVEEFVKWYI